MSGPDFVDDVAAEGLLPTVDGLEDFWGSGHVSGPFDPDEIALLEEAHEVPEAAE